MNYVKSLAATMVAVLLMAAGGYSASAQPIIYSPASPLQIINRRDSARWLAVQKRALIDTRNARRRDLKIAYASALRRTYGHQRRSVVDGYRHDLAAMNDWFRAEMGALQAALRSPAAQYKSSWYVQPEFACEPLQRDNRRQEIREPAAGTEESVLPPADIVVPPTPLPPTPEAGGVPSVPVPPPPTDIYDDRYHAPQASYRQGLMARLAALRSWLGALFVQLGLTA